MVTVPKYAWQFFLKEKIIKLALSSKYSIFLLISVNETCIVDLLCTKYCA